MDKTRENAMEMSNENTFIHDPFLSLDHDLDDVSGKFFSQKFRLFF